MAQYKWKLRKGSKKDVCPQCGKKRFVPFVLTEDPSVKAGPEYGRCDREQSCGYFRYPGSEVATEPQAAYTPEPKKPMAVFGMPVVTDTLENNTLYAAFRDLLGDSLRVSMESYRIATGWSGECIYFQYDGEWVRTGKAIMYGKDGHRLKHDDGSVLPVWWLHKAPMNASYMETHELRQCFFGQHLLLEYPDLPVVVVEAEKTAVLMRAYDILNNRHDRMWLACGGSQMLKGAIDLMPLVSRDVTLIPDHGQYWNWKRTAAAYGWQCQDIEVLKKMYGLADGCDIWDIYEKMLKEWRTEYIRVNERGGKE